jgi:predicted nucleotidyltransferase
MAVNFESIKEDVVNYVKDVKKAMPIDRAYLYGSYAKGTAERDSDVDLCFFSHTFDDDDTIKIVTKLLGLSGKYQNIDVEPHVFNTAELENDNPFVKEILRTGVEL